MAELDEEIEYQVKASTALLQYSAVAAGVVFAFSRDSVAGVLCYSLPVLPVSVLIARSVAESECAPSVVVVVGEVLLVFDKTGL